MKKSYALSLLLLSSMFSAFTVHANSEITPQYRNYPYVRAGHYKCEDIKKDIVTYEKYHSEDDVPNLCPENLIPKVLEVKVLSEIYSPKYKNDWGNDVYARTRCTAIIKHTCLTPEEFMEQKEN